MPILNGKQVRLTQDWAPGNVKITVAQFESNIASGTPPLVIASNTRVPNLNADLLDGIEASAFPLLAGRSGGQTLIGGTASGNDLTLQSTSHATKGKILFGTSAYDEVNNRLGIGTASPNDALSVVGQITATGTLTAGTISSTGDVSAGASTELFRQITGGSAGMGILSSGLISILTDTDDTSASNGTVLQARVGGTTPSTSTLLWSIFKDGRMNVQGRLGINGVVPSTTLHIFEDTAVGPASSGLTIENAGNGDASMNFFETGGQRWTMGLDNSEANRFALNVGNTLAVAANFSIHPNGRVGIGIRTILSKLHIDQASTTAAIPVLLLDQADISEEMIEFRAVIGTGNPIEAVAAKTLTTTHFIKITIQGGLTRYIEVGTIA